jgi:hypothetical protein
MANRVARMHTRILCDDTPPVVFHFLKAKVSQGSSKLEKDSQVETSRSRGRLKGRDRVLIANKFRRPTKVSMVSITVGFIWEVFNLQ